MVVTGFQINDALKLTPVAPEEVEEAIQLPGARVWLDLQVSEPDELEGWLDRLGIEGLCRRLCLEAHDRPGFYPLKGEIFLVVPVLAGTPGSPEVEHVAFLCREHLLLTLHRQKSPLRNASLEAEHKED
jgi:Mg2+ and Co2+ transporter CorA